MPELSLPPVINTNPPGQRNNILDVKFPDFSLSIVHLATFTSKLNLVVTTLPLTWPTSPTLSITWVSVSLFPTTSSRRDYKIHPLDSWKLPDPSMEMFTLRTKSMRPIIIIWRWLRLSLIRNREHKRSTTRRRDFTNHWTRIGHIKSCRVLSFHCIGRILFRRQSLLTIYHLLPYLTRRHRELGMITLHHWWLSLVVPLPLWECWSRAFTQFHQRKDDRLLEDMQQKQVMKRMSRFIFFNQSLTCLGGVSRIPDWCPFSVRSSHRLSYSYESLFCLLNE